MKPLNEKIDPKFVLQAKKLAKYTQLLQQILPIECRNHVKVANIRNQNLMLITDSPVWTTRLRQLSPKILQFIRENSIPTDTGNKKSPIIHHIQISTRYNEANSDQVDARQQQRAAEKKKNQPRVSEKTAKLLSQSANSINHQSLKAALLRIASHGKVNKNHPGAGK